MEIPKEESKKLGVPVALFLVSLLMAVLGGGLLTYMYLPQIKVVEKVINAEVSKEPEPQTYSSDQYKYSFSYPSNLRLERSSKGEGGYVQESIDLYESTGKIRMSVKVISKTGVQCPYYSLDQFVHCAFLRWQNFSSVPMSVSDKKGIRLVSQASLPPYDIQVATYFEKGDYIFEVSDFIGASRLDEQYSKLLESLNI